MVLTTVLHHAFLIMQLILLFYNIPDLTVEGRAVSAVVDTKRYVIGGTGDTFLSGMTSVYAITLV